MSDIYTNPPQSRNEAILRATIDRTEYEAPPQSRIEDLLIELKEAIEQGACTENYNDLSNKPQIGGVTLEGDKSLKDLSAVATSADQGLTDTEKSNARTNIDTPSNSDIQSSITPPKASVVTVTDAAPINAEDITVDITPQQDLHGYDHPWAGGAGKNKVVYPYTSSAGSWNGQTVTDSDGLITVEGVQNGVSLFLFCQDIKIKAGTTYTLSTHFEYASDNELYIYMTLYDFNKSKLLANIAGPDETFTFTADDDYSARLYLNPSYSSDGYYFHYTVRPQLEEGNQATSYAPYSNECPLTGWIGEELDRVGKNQWDEEWELGTFDANGNEVSASDRIRSKNNIRCYPSQTMFFKSPNYGYLFFYDRYNNFVSTLTKAPNTAFTVPNNAVYMRFRIDPAYGTTYNNDISINYPSTDTQYHAYQGISRTINFGQTVYGGKCHATEGGTDVTHANIADYNGETINEPWLSSLDEYTPGATPTTGAQVVYPLTTPTTINTNAVDIPMLKGFNTISANTGDVSLKYQPDNVIGELKGMIQEVESEVDALNITDMLYNTFIELGIEGEFQIDRINNEIHVVAIIDDSSIATQTSTADLETDLPDTLKCKPGHAAEVCLRHSSGTGKIILKYISGDNIQKFELDVEEVNTTSGVWFPIYQLIGKAL